LFRQFVLKIHSRCDLACRHCYMYEAVDQRWRQQPRVMAPETVGAAARVIARHAERHALPAVDVVLHGGEPLLLPPDRLGALVADLRAAISPVAGLRLSVQTNGVRLGGPLGTAYADLFLREGIHVGISLDGGRVANDRHRLYRDGSSSYDQAVRGIARMTVAPYRPMFAGILCTVDVENDPIEVFTELAALRPPRIDLLLPHATWEHPPPGAREGATPYGDWLCAVFDHWFDAPPLVGVRLFEELVNALLGGASHSEAIGRSTPESVVIETDGALERTDALKVTYEGAARTGHVVFDDSVVDVLADTSALGDSGGEASPTCRSCSVFETCGGGLYAHRYRPGTGFANPSVYCHDLRRLIEHVDGRLRRDLARLPSGRAPVEMVR
jgi:uncharacterized protein